MNNASIYDMIDDELQRALVHGNEMNSLHEAWAVIYEELHEVEEIMLQKQKLRSADKLKKELIQVAAMCVKSLNSPIFNTTSGYRAGHTSDE